MSRTPSSICPFPYAEGYTLSASRAAGGEPPLLKVHIGDTHLCTNSAARAAGGKRPLWKRPGAMRPRKCRISSGPGGHPPPVSQPCTLGEVLVTCRSSPYCLSVGVSVWLRSRALRTAGTHFSRHPWACQCGTPARVFYACS